MEWGKRKEQQEEEPCRHRRTRPEPVRAARSGRAERGARERRRRGRARLG